jgi:hypothetical protein
MIGEVEVNQGRWKVENEDGNGERRTANVDTRCL